MWQIKVYKSPNRNLVKVWHNGRELKATYLNLEATLDGIPTLELALIDEPVRIEIEDGSVDIVDAQTDSQQEETAENIKSPWWERLLNSFGRYDPRFYEGAP